MDVIRIEEKFYILANSDRAAQCARVLKQGETFAVFDCHGDVQPIGLGEQGIFHEGTRFLSKMELRFGGVRPLLLGSTVHRENDLLAIDLMNPDFVSEEITVRRDSVHIFRSTFLWEGTCFQQVRLTNFSLDTVRLPFTVTFGADFADIFEVRGTSREKRGELLPPEVAPDAVTLSYRGLDEVVRSTKIAFAPQPARLEAEEAEYQLLLEPKESMTVDIAVACGCRACRPFQEGHNEALEAHRQSIGELQRQFCDIVTDNAHFNLLLERSRSDLIMMLTRTPQGNYPYAGVPWFSTAFGRDGIITALETLWVNPQIARGVLNFLAAVQADETDAENDAEPGKIIHETRRGEMAALGEIPFGRYYGSVDSTPLFVVLAGAYYRSTGDRELIGRLWANIKRALEWIDRYGDADGDGFVEYARHSHQGLVQQGWKDSNDSVFHADGSLAQAPIALCEVQGYVYQAKLEAAGIAALLGEDGYAEELRAQAATLREKFEAAFWCEDLSFYALALDGEKKPCRVRSSNVGHCLYSGIVAPDRARKVARQLLSEDFFTGWGIRTLSSSEARYNPMSYHNGSIWPHDNALIAHGLTRYGMSEEAMAVLQGIYETSLSMDLHRLPELFCGFKRRGDSLPILYPVACAPQSWAAASVYLLLQGCMGLAIAGEAGKRKELRFVYPCLPPFLDEVKIGNLRIGADCAVDVVLKRYGKDVTVSVVRKEGEVEVVIVK